MRLRPSRSASSFALLLCACAALAVASPRSRALLVGLPPSAPAVATRRPVDTGVEWLSMTREPALAGIDPYRRLIDRGRDDNLVELDG